MNLVSILICSYNASTSILSTIHSCLAQTYQHIEVLIHDDQSTDDTRAKILSLTDNRIRLIDSGRKLGPYGGLNFLLDHAKGDYVAIQDHDDLRHPDKLKRQIDFLSTHPEYVGCGTQTLMWYEGDQQGFDYLIGKTAPEKEWKETSYTIHPSLVFRANRSYRYDTNSIYMQDAVFQKNILCQGKPLIANLSETLTLHLIKRGAKNFSYQWFTYDWSTLQTVFALHPIWYAVCILGFETMRKVLYPIFHGANCGSWIDRFERLPFVLLGKKIESYPKNELAKKGFVI